MLKRLLLPFILFSSILFNSCENSTSVTNYNYNAYLANSLGKIGDSLVSNIVINNINRSIPGVIIGVKHPEIDFTYLGSFGKSNLTTGDNLFRADRIRIGSITKSFIATLAFRLIDDGIININAPISDYIKVPHSGGLITVKNLLASRSGLRDYIDSVRFYQELEPNKVWTKTELMNFSFKANPLNYPNLVSVNNNIDYLLLSMIIESVTGDKLDNLIKNRILNILDLSNTGFPNNAAIEGVPYSHGYIWSQQSGIIDYTNKYDYSWTWGSMNMVSNSHDLLVWAEALGTGRLISSNSFNLMQDFKHLETKPTYDKLLGSGIMKIGSFIGYSGEFDGYYTSLYYLPSRKIVIYIFTSSENDNDALMVKIANLLIPEYKFK